MSREAVETIGTVKVYNAVTGEVEEVERVIKSDEEWRRQLTPEQFAVARHEGTEPAFTGKYWDCKEDGLYVCVCCGNHLFSSKTKFESGTGWPSFTKPVSDLNIRTDLDTRFFMSRTEVLCRRCDAHLGHVFDDGPPPTHTRYCMNSASLRFVRQRDLQG
ncbi:MAG: peptide-methionine (R)-S-oxide reductase MsrB [Methanoculleus sp.]|nr:peptide-methionine (R)-S-oxide reductase MsrB [Methanoculleus sp.]